MASHSSRLSLTLLSLSLSSPSSSFILLLYSTISGMARMIAQFVNVDIMDKSERMKLQRKK